MQNDWTPPTTLTEADAALLSMLSGQRFKTKRELALELSWSGTAVKRRLQRLRRFGFEMESKTCPDSGGVRLTPVGYERTMRARDAGGLAGYEPRGGGPYPVPTQSLPT